MSVEGEGRPDVRTVSGVEVVTIPMSHYARLLEQENRPEARTISGVETVNITMGHYAHLLDCWRLVAEAGLTERRRTANVRCRIDRDPEVAAFMIDCLGLKLLKDTHAECLERFGPERTPGKTTIQRFWKGLGRR